MSPFRIHTKLPILNIKLRKTPFFLDQARKNETFDDKNWRHQKSPPKFDL